MRIVEFAFIVYPATDLARSRAFYEDVLGLISATCVNDGDQFWVEYEIGPHTLGIGNEPFLKPSGDGSPPRKGKGVGPIIYISSGSSC